MNYLKYLGIALLPILLASCNDDKAKATAKPAEEVYDYRDERYQDFYSRYMRKTGKDYLILNPKNVQEELDLKSIPEGYGWGRVDISRINTFEKINNQVNNLQTKYDILKYYQERGHNYVECDLELQESNFICLQNEQTPNLSRVYYYVPKESIKMDYIDQPISFSCVVSNGKKNCRLFHWLSVPYNLKLTMHFTNPQNFFYIVPYVEKHFFNATGEHIWQTLPKQK